MAERADGVADIDFLKRKRINLVEKDMIDDVINNWPEDSTKQKKLYKASASVSIM
ncbi:MAG: hypothetical protein HYW88_03160 [Candidatus Sungbacteria bacterium]|nr:hypothetical protein [Candidatus Sungbacteria bacterium]